MVCHLESRWVLMVGASYELGQAVQLVLGLRQEGGYVGSLIEY